MVVAAAGWPLEGPPAPLHRGLGLGRRRLGPSPGTCLRLARSPTYAGRSLTARWNCELLAGLKALSEREDATLFMTLLAAFKVLIESPVRMLL